MDLSESKRKSGGEFLIQLGHGIEHAVPNQFTVIGMQQVLQAAFWGITGPWYMGLCAHNPDDSVPMSVLNEPTVGVNGYQRVTLPREVGFWPVIGQVNGESYVESGDCTFTPAGGAFDQQTNRLFLTDGAQVIAISAAFEAGLTFQATPMTTRYRLYFR